jgi:hypothetical protein
MKKLIVATAMAFLSGAAFAQNTGPAPQTGMEQPGMTNGNMKREKDGAPGKKDDKK